MPRKVTPRWGEDGVVKFPDFTLSESQFAEIITPLGLSTSRASTELRARLEEIGAYHLLWIPQDESGPSRAERNAALRRVSVSSPEDVKPTLAKLDYATRAELLDALWAHLIACGRKLELLDQIACDEPGLIIDCARRLLEEGKRRRGPPPRKTMPIIIRWLVSVYEKATGLEFTHNPYEKTEYRGAPQSPAGHFVTTFLKFVDPTLPETAIATEMARVVKTRRGSS